VLNKALVLIEEEIDGWYEKNGFIRDDKLTEEELKFRDDKLKRLFEELKKRR